MTWSACALRSLLFAPGSSSRKLEKVGTFGSDAVVLDLEDAVADGEKAAARELVHSALPTYEHAVVMVRVNGAGTGRLEGDLEAVVSSSLDCVVVPKVEDPGTLAAVDASVARLERERDLAEGRVRLIASVETARGLVCCEEIALAASPRLLTLLFGLGDFSAEVGLEPARDGFELLYARSRIVTAARAAGLHTPLDGPFLDLRDVDGLTDDSRRSRRLGFQGRVAVYPPQVAHIQRAYAELSPDEAERARRIVEAFERAEASGSAAIQVDGRFVDYPIYRHAKRTLRLHESAASEPA